jgi:fucose permease
MDPNLIKACEMFLVPAAILFAALGLASKEQLKTLLSLMGLAISLTWAYRILEWEGLPKEDKTTALLLALIFVAGAAISTIVHCRNWLCPTPSGGQGKT